MQQVFGGLKIPFLISRISKSLENIIYAHIIEWCSYYKLLVPGIGFWFHWDPFGVVPISMRLASKFTLQVLKVFKKHALYFCVCFER